MFPTEMKRFLRLIFKRPWLAWTVIAFTAYAFLVVLTTYWAIYDRIHGEGYSILWSTKEASFQASAPDAQGFDHIRLESLDPLSGELSATYMMNAPESLASITVCPWFGHEEVDINHVSGWVEDVVVHLAKDPVQPSDLPKGYAKFTGKFTIHPVIVAKRFPFDKVTLDIHYRQDEFAACKDAPDAKLTPPAFLDVVNNISGFSVDKDGLKYAHQDGNTLMHLRLERNSFLRGIAVLVAVLAVVSTLLLAKGMWRKQTKDWTPLAYFASLWGVRDIFLSLIPDPKPFPTLVDVSVLYLLALILIVWVAANARGKAPKSG